jgi:hypothetical protein
LGTNKNHDVTNLENKEPAEAQEFTCSSEIHVVVVKLDGTNRLQFPSELASPSSSNGPGLQDNIFDSL